MIAGDCVQLLCIIECGSLKLVVCENSSSIACVVNLCFKLSVHVFCELNVLLDCECLV